jgi:hypothetical protein
MRVWLVPVSLDAIDVSLLQTLHQTFARLLSSKDWAVVSFAISSLVSFGSTCNPAHQRILPLCLPKERVGLFQSRIKGEVWRDRKSGGTTDNDPFPILHRTASRLNLCTPCSPRTEFGKSVFPSKAASFIVAPGSYFVEMTAHEGRKALVIFPPDPKSLEDINYMCGDQDEDQRPRIQIFQRGIALPGGGLQCLLQESS